MKLKLFATTLLVSSLSFVQPSRADVLVGSPGDSGSGDCAPFGCVLHYQQAYDSSLFSGPLQITGLTFFNTILSPGSIDAAHYTITLSTGGGQVGSLSATFANNIGPGAATFFSGNLGGSIVGGQFTITGSPFSYNPAAGDLLLDVVKSSSSGPSVYLDFRNSNFSGFERVYSFGATETGSLNGSYGLVTQFDTGGVTPVPEPVSLALVGAGLVGLGGIRSRRKA